MAAVICVPRHALIFNDIHYDPYHLTPDAAECSSNTSSVYGQYDCSASKLLLQSAFAASAVAVPDPIFIGLVGDAIRYYGGSMPGSPEEVAVTIRSVLEMINATFPSVPILFNIGNHDTSPSWRIEVVTGDKVDYSLGRCVEVFGDFFPSDEARRTFQLGGFYTYEVSPLLIIMNINTLIYHKNHKPDTTKMDDPFGQFAWMEGVLSTAKSKGVMVILFGHAGPIVDETTRSYTWRRNYVYRFRTIFRNFRGVLKFHMYGHQHIDEFRTYEPESGIDAPLFLLGPLFPACKDCNPSFRVLQIDDESGELLDYTVWAGNLAEATPEELPWGVEYSLLEQFHLPDASNTALRSLARSMLTDRDLWEKFLAVAYMGGTGYLSCGLYCRVIFTCLALYSVDDLVSDCTQAKLDPLAPIITPPNDRCGNAIRVQCGASVSGTTVGASLDDSLSACAQSLPGPVVWYQVALPRGLASLVVSTCAPIGFDTQLALYRGASCGGMSCAAKKDDGCGSQSLLTMPSPPADEYAVAVFGFAGAFGNFILNVSCNYPDPSPSPWPSISPFPSPSPSLSLQPFAIPSPDPTLVSDFLVPSPDGSPSPSSDPISDTSRSPSPPLASASVSSSPSPWHSPQPSPSSSPGPDPTLDSGSPSGSPSPGQSTSSSPSPRSSPRPDPVPLPDPTPSPSPSDSPSPGHSATPSPSPAPASGSPSPIQSPSP
eukprot:EG_transcript_4895